MAPERKLYQKIKKSFTDFSLIRLENLSLSGTPDLLGYNNSGNFFTVELKVSKSNKVQFSPHQIAFHVKHPRNSFILVEHLGQRSVKLFPGSGIKALDAWGLKLATVMTALPGSPPVSRLQLAACGPDQAHAVQLPARLIG